MLVAIAAAAAFYGGMRYQQIRAFTAAQPQTNATPAQETPEARFNRLRREVDNAPGAMAQRLKSELDGQAPEAREPQMRYLYGRALMLSGQQKEAMQVFDQVIRDIDAQTAKPVRDPVRVETRLATAAAALKSNDPAAVQKAARDLDEVIEQQAAAGGAVAASPSPAQ
jgi:hypothetical protein